MKSHILTQNYTMRVLAVTLLPLLIYLFELLGKVSGIAALIAGVLLFTKILLDTLSIPHAPVRQVKQRTRIVPCYLCQHTTSQPIPCHVPGKRMLVCPNCYQSITFSGEHG
jgi:hypothetical protein